MRNRGTLGGNICVNDPTNHFPPLLVALGATMTVASVDGERTVSAEEFFVGVFETTVREGELLTRITRARRRQGQRRRHVGGHARRARHVHRERGGVRRRRHLADRARVRRRGAGPRDRRRGALSATDVDEAAVRAAVEGLGATLDPPSDVHASAEYRRSLAETSIVRAVLQADERARG